MVLVIDIGHIKIPTYLLRHLVQLALALLAEDRAFGRIHGRPVVLVVGVSHLLQFLTELLGSSL